MEHHLRFPCPPDRDDPHHLTAQSADRSPVLAVDAPNHEEARLSIRYDRSDGQSVILPKRLSLDEVYAVLGLVGVTLGWVELEVDRAK
jgi:hypothetical protein